MHSCGCSRFAYTVAGLACKLATHMHAIMKHAEGFTQQCFISELYDCYQANTKHRTLYYTHFSSFLSLPYSTLLKYVSQLHTRTVTKYRQCQGSVLHCHSLSTMSCACKCGSRLGRENVLNQVESMSYKYNAVVLFKKNIEYLWKY